MTTHPRSNRTHVPCNDDVRQHVHNRSRQCTQIENEPMDKRCLDQPLPTERCIVSRVPAVAGARENLHLLLAKVGPIYIQGGSHRSLRLRVKAGIVNGKTCNMGDDDKINTNSTCMMKCSVLSDDSFGQNCDHHFTCTS